ncbi:biopolymer transporter ExbD [Pseudomonas gingeri]|uniref:Biopolymer transporter ExbD n=1 Tax=Pseudomonas gingeri TaxID=117681 RepID=A0A7Y8C2W0_9PSED|nr:biopolymer transporter ExbD [Pseudomonas gingeri]NWB97024.1 biopolymer transporter ExbD [Pseudomonas gingeri]
MAFSSSQNDDVISDINITPLVDVMLVLLVTFIVTAPLLSNAITLDLPQTVATGEPSQQHAIAVSVDASGQVFVDTTVMPFDQLPAKLQTLHEQEPDVAITLRADRSAEYGKVAQVLAEVRKAGITQLSVITETP